VPSPRTLKPTNRGLRSDRSWTRTRRRPPSNVTWTIWRACEALRPSSRSSRHCWLELRTEFTGCFTQEIHRDRGRNVEKQLLIRQLLEQAIESGVTPEEVCRGAPDLLLDVRQQ
jgi:hypothetical protein